MNFFAHAVVASWQDERPAFVLGAMLPDLASMCGTRVDTIESEPVQGGVTHHHRADAVFHDLPWFTLRMRRWSALLRSRGVRRGPALGAAHVGVEIAIDAALASSGHGTEAFTRALEIDRGDRWQWRDPHADERYQSLRQRLRQGDPAAPPEMVSARVVACLRRRPRLAMNQEESGSLAEVVTAESPEIEAALPDLLAALRVRLSTS